MLRVPGVDELLLEALGRRGYARLRHLPVVRRPAVARQAAGGPGQEVGAPLPLRRGERETRLRHLPLEPRDERERRG